MDRSLTKTFLVSKSNALNVLFLKLLSVCCHNCDLWESTLLAISLIVTMPTEFLDKHSSTLLTLLLIVYDDYKFVTKQELENLGKQY